MRIIHSARGSGDKWARHEFSRVGIVTKIKEQRYPFPEIIFRASENNNMLYIDY